ncbi:MAG: type III pantothenate kinase [Flavobacterium sp.]
MLLAIDAGNTRSKWAVFENDTVVDFDSCTNNALENELKKILKIHPKIQNAIFSSVTHSSEKEIDFLKSIMYVKVVSRNDAFPFVNLYKSPETLGIDRMILSASAVLKFPNTNRFIIDAGSCITYDFVDEQNQYHGGAISPGLQMRYNAMHHFTAKLPQLEVSEINDFVGQDTTTSMHSGVVNGVIGEINHMIQSIVGDSENFTIILTGGDTVFLAKRLKSTIFAHSNFLLEGLNRYFYFLKKHA